MIYHPYYIACLGTVFDQSTGLLKYLDINFEKLVSNVDHIYSLGHK